jgi:hypothetical protein
MAAVRQLERGLASARRAAAVSAPECGVSSVNDRQPFTHLTAACTAESRIERTIESSKDGRNSVSSATSKMIPAFCLEPLARAIGPERDFVGFNLLA